MKRKAMIAVSIAAALMVFYFYSLKSQLIEARSNQDNYKNKISNLSAVKESEATQANKAFLKRFFNYSNTKERYNNIKPLMTSRGFQGTHPSGASLPTMNSEVESSTNNLKAYEHKESRTEAEYINEFDLSTKFNGVSNTESVLVKTKLLYVDKKGWLIDDLEFLQ